jgi:hypothetical protein
VREPIFAAIGFGTVGLDFILTSGLTNRAQRLEWIYLDGSSN